MREKVRSFHGARPLHPETIEGRNVELETSRARLARDFVSAYFPTLGVTDESRDIRKGMRGILTLYLYNRMARHKNMPIVAIDRLCTRMYQKMYHAERHASRQKALPTIGCEVEIEEGWRKDGRNEDTHQILSECGVTHETHNNDISHPRSDQLEVNHLPSYSAALQARLVHELTLLGALRTEVVHKRDADGMWDPRVRHLRRGVYSMHVNVGVRDRVFSELRKHDDAEANMHAETALLSLLLTIAFNSPHRMKGRKTRNAYYIWDEGVVSFAKKPPEFRIELRTPEVRDHQTYRMLHEVQLVGACMIAFCYRGCEGFTETEEALAKAWERLMGSRFVQSVAVRGALVEDAVDRPDPKMFIKTYLTKTKIRKACGVIHDAAAEAREILRKSGEHERMRRPG